MKKYAITIVVFLWLGVLLLDVLTLGQRGRYDFSEPGTFDLIRIGNFTLQQDNADNDGLELNGSIHTAIVGGKSGNFCIHEANEPTASNDSTGSRLWVDPNGVLKHQKSSDAGSGSRTIIVDDGAGNVGFGTNDPKRELDFDGGNIRTQRYLDSDLNTNLGYETFGAGNLSGTHNSAFGRQSLYSIASGSGNSGLGNETLYNVTTGGNNVAIGSMSGKGVVDGSHNISLGYKSGYVIAGGNNNISIGSYSNYVGTGSKNIIIGYNIDLPVDAGNNQLNIGNLIYGTGLDGVDKTVSTGKVGIGTPPTEKLDVDGNIKANGNIIVTGTVDGIDVSAAVAANTTHRSSSGANHSYINQSVTTSGTPTFDGLMIDFYTQLGDGGDHPHIQLKKYTGTTNASTTTDFAHSLTGSKILATFPMIYTGAMYIPPEYTGAANYHYSFYFNNTTLNFRSVDANCQSKPYVVTVIYAQ